MDEEEIGGLVVEAGFNKGPYNAKIRYERDEDDDDDDVDDDDDIDDEDDDDMGEYGLQW